MKFAIVLSVFLATICFIQAHNLEITLKAFYDDQVPTSGKLAITLIGEKETKFLTADNTEFGQYVDIVIKTEFSEDVKNVKVDWASVSNKPLLLGFMMINVDDNSDFVHFLMQKDIENGTTETFERIN